jgi:malate permease and related proteins
MNQIGQIILEILGVVLPVFIVIGTGILIRKKGFIKEEHIPLLNRLTYSLGLSSLIFLDIAGSKFSDIFNSGTLKIVYSAYFSYIFVIFFIFYFSKIDGKTKGAIIVSSFRNNMAFIGMPILLYAFGPVAAAKAGVVIATILPLNIILTFVFFQFIKTDHRDEMSDKKMATGDSKNRTMQILLLIRSILTDPVIIAVIAGLLISYFNLKIPGPVNSLFDILSGLAVPLALLCIGASFRFRNIKKNINYLLLLNILKLFIFPAVALFFCRIVFKAGELDTTVICTLFAAPTAVATFMQGSKFETNHNFISSAIITTTILSALTISLWLFVLRIV